MSTYSMDYSIEEEIIEVPLTDDSRRASGRSLKRSSGQSMDGSVHSVSSSYTFEEVESVYSEYTFEELNDSFSSFTDAAASTPPPAAPAAPPPTNVAIPRDSISDMKNYLRSELGLDIPSKKEEQKEAPKRKSALDDMKSYLRSELGIDVPPPKAKTSASTTAASLDLPISSFSMDKSKKPKESLSFGDSELARSIAFLKEGVDVEEIEYIVSDEEEIIDDVFDHMGGLDGRDTVMLESFGLAAIPEISHSEYDSEIDDSVHMARTSEISMLSTGFEMAVGDTGSDNEDDEVDTEPIKPKPTGLHETPKNAEEAVISDSMDIDESKQAENQESPSKKSGKAEKWKDRIKKKRRKSEKGGDDMDVDIDSSRTNQKASREAQHTNKGQSPESKADSFKGKKSDDRLDPTKAREPSSETKAKKGKGESKSSTKESGESKSKKHKGESDSKTDKKESSESKYKKEKGDSDRKVDKKESSESKSKKDKRHTDSKVGKKESSESKSKKDKVDSDSKVDKKESSESKSKKDKVNSDSKSDKKESSESKSKKDKGESESKADAKDESSKDSSKSSKRGKKAAKWKERVQKKRNKSMEEKHEVDIKAPKSPTLDARAEIDAGENDLKDATQMPIHEENAKSKQIQEDSGDVVMQVDGLGSKSDTEQAKKRRSSKKKDRTKDKRLSDTIGEVKGDEDNEREQSGGTAHSMRIFDDEFGSVGGPSAHLDRASVSFDTLSEHEESDGVIYEMDLKDEPDNSGRSRTASRSLRGVFDDELGDTASNGRSSIFSMQSSGVLEELDDIDEDDETPSSNDERDEEASLLSKEPSAEFTKSDVSSGAAKKNEVRSARESTEESLSNFKFELPTELLEAIHCHHNNKNANEKQTDRDSSDVLRTQNETPVEKEKDGSATYSTLPPTVEDCSRTLGEEVAENNDASLSTGQPGTQVQKCANRFPGRLAPDQRVIDNATGKYTCFIAAYEMITRQRRREIVLKSAEIASGGKLSSSSDWKYKYSRDASIGDRNKLVELLRVKPKMVTRAGRKELVMESIKATNPPESWTVRVLGKQDELDKKNTDITASIPDSTDKISKSSRGSGSSSISVRKATSKVGGSKNSKTDEQTGFDSNKVSKISSKHKKHAKTNGVSRSQGTEEGKKSSHNEMEEHLSVDSSNRSKSENSKSSKGKTKKSNENEAEESLSFDSSNRSNDGNSKHSKGKTKKSSETETEESLSIDGSNRSKGENSRHAKGKARRSPDRSETPKTTNRKRSKTRGKKAPGRSRSLGTEDFLASLKANEDTGQTSQGETTDDKGTKNGRNRSRGVRRTLSLGPMEGARGKKRKEKRNGEGNGSDWDDRNEKRGDVSIDVNEPESSANGKNHLSEIKGPASPRATEHKMQHNNSEEENPDVLLSPATTSKRIGSTGKSPKAEKTSLRRSQSGGNLKSPRSEEENPDVLLSPGTTSKRKSSNGKSPKSERASLRRSQSGGNQKLPRSEEENPDVLLSPRTTSKRKSSIGKSPKSERASLRRSKSGSSLKSPRNARKSLDNIGSPTAKKKSVDLLNSPSSKKKSINLSEDLTIEMKSPKKGRSRMNESPAADKPSLRRGKSGDTKSPRNSSRKSLDKVRSPAGKKKSLSTIPDLGSDLLSPKKSQSSRRSSDTQSPRTPGKKNGNRRHSDSPMQQAPPVDQQSAFMEYYDSVRVGRRSLVGGTVDLADLQVPSLPSASAEQRKSVLMRGQSDSATETAPEQRKSELRRGQSESATDVIEEDTQLVVDDIWGLVKWRDQVDRTVSTKGFDPET